MKRFLVLIVSLVIGTLISAQQSADYLMKAKAFIESGKNKEAIDLLSEALLKNPDYRFYLEKAEAEMAAGDFNHSGTDFRLANSLAISSGEYGLARIMAIKGDAVNALIHLENNISSPFRKKEKEIMLDVAFSSIENTPEWRQFWKKERYTVVERKTSEIEYYVSTGDMEDALNVLNELTSGYPEDPTVKYARALVDFSRGRYNESIASLTSLLGDDKNNEIYLKLLARVQSSAGNPAGATQSYTSIINSGEPDASLLILRAEGYSKTGETDKALIDITKFLSFYPGNKSALSLAGKLAAQSGDNLKAIDYFSTNLKLHPGDPECYTDRANSYLVSRTWEPAISDYSMALDIQPANPDTWLNKGIALLNSDKAEDACHDFRMALMLGNKKASGFIGKYCIK